MKTYTAAQLRAAELPFLQAGVPLMARASAALAAETATLLSERRGGVDGSTVLVLAGAGNNGGDALHAAASLAGWGATVSIVPTANRLHEEGLAAALQAGAQLLSAALPDAAILDLVRGSDVVLDGILGTGASASPALRGRAREVVRAMLPAVTGTCSPVLPADVTVTFGGCKPGLVKEPASRYVGRIVSRRHRHHGRARADSRRQRPLTGPVREGNSTATVELGEAMVSAWTGDAVASREFVHSASSVGAWEAGRQARATCANEHVTDQRTPS